jgi:MFS family permease
MGRGLIAFATILTLMPVTLLVPGQRELVQDRFGTSDGLAHAFMTVNMLAGIAAVPFIMRWQKRVGALRWWIASLLLLDAGVFLAMRAADSFGALLAWRALDGALHLPAITLLMVAANRLAGPRRGGSLGLLGTSLMVGVALGSPLGGAIVDRAPTMTYVVGASLLACAAVVALRLTSVPDANASQPSRRYAWNTHVGLAWVPLAYAFMDRFAIGVFVSTFTLYVSNVVRLTGAQRGGLMALFLVPFALLCWPAGRLADRIGWMKPLIVSNVLFGVIFATYAVLPVAWLPAAMVCSGVLSALMFAPNLVLTSEVARVAGEGVFGAFQIAGSVGFLLGPALGGVLVAVWTSADGAVRYGAIFALVGALEVALALASGVALTRLVRRRVLSPANGRRDDALIPPPAHA